MFLQNKFGSSQRVKKGQVRHLSKNTLSLHFDRPVFILYPVIYDVIQPIYDHCLMNIKNYLLEIDSLKSPGLQGNECEPPIFSASEGSFLRWFLTQTFFYPLLLASFILQISCLVFAVPSTSVQDETALYHHDPFLRNT